jgi:exopolyphosphatase/guanosine-5'-triphosphate,3'-diphosphate pyrophosphatase
MDATFAALKDYRNQLLDHHFHPEDTLVTATEASRVATNAQEFFSKIKAELGFTITLISPVGEAFYTALGVASVIENKKEIIVMDMGGASTELIHIQLSPFAILSSVSLPVGSVRATDWIIEKSFDEHMKNIIDQDFTDYQTKNLLCVAGSMTSLASMFLGHRNFMAQEIDGKRINFLSFQEFCIDLQKTNHENLQLLFPFLGKRAPMIAAAGTVAHIIGNKLNIESIQISTRGLRYGVLIQGAIDEQFKIKYFFRLLGSPVLFFILTISILLKKF